MLPKSITTVVIGLMASAAVSVRAEVADLSPLLGQPKTRIFAVERDAAGRWTTGHGESFYSQTISNTAPVFVTANGALVAQLLPDGSLGQMCVFNGDTIRVGEKPCGPGGWVSLKRGLAKLPVFRIKLAGGPITPAADWPVKTAFLLNALPTAEYAGPGLTVKLIACAPISADGTQRPRGLIWAVLLRNESAAPIEGEISLSEARGMVVKGLEPNAGFKLPPGGEAGYAARLTMANDDDADSALAAREAGVWLSDTCSYWRRVTGNFVMPGDPFTAELFTRCNVAALQSGVFNELGQAVGILYGLSPLQGCFNFRDSFYAILPAAQRDPAYLRPFIDWNNRYATHPPTKRFPRDVLHSLGNTLCAAMQAGLYYRSTGDVHFFTDHPDLVQSLRHTLDTVLATRKESEPWLFHSDYISDGRSLGRYHTGSNVCLWYSLTSLADILEATGGDREIAKSYREIAAKIKAELDRRNILPTGPFGPQYVEGTDADGSVTLMIHDGEESDTTLMPYYGYCAVDAAPYLNFMRFAVSPHNVAFNPETRGIVWENYGSQAKVKPVGPWLADATFPGYITALAGCRDAESLRGERGYLTELRRLTDVNGTFWWWPYNKGNKRGEVQRGIFECGWTEGEFAALFPANYLGIRYDAPERVFRFSPTAAIGDFTWEDFPVGFEHFTVRYVHGVATVKNLTDRTVSVCIGSSPPVRLLPGSVTPAAPPSTP